MKEYKNESGQLHRTDGPAVEWNNGDKWWFINGELHREDGPAIECSDGSKEWYLNGIEYSEDQFHQELIKLKLKRIVEL
jgi:hypothetical protein